MIPFFFLFTSLFYPIFTRNCDFQQPFVYPLEKNRFIWYDQQYEAKQFLNEKACFAKPRFVKDHKNVTKAATCLI